MSKHFLCIFPFPWQQKPPATESKIRFMDTYIVFRSHARMDKGKCVILLCKTFGSETNLFIEIESIDFGDKFNTYCCTSVSNHESIYRLRFIIVSNIVWSILLNFCTTFLEVFAIYKLYCYDFVLKHSYVLHMCFYN